MTTPKPTAEAFLTTVKKSGLVEPERLQKVLDAFRAAGGDMESTLAVAEYLVSHQAISKWQAEKLLQGKHKGYFLGKYRLLSLLGKGGMSSVFLAEHILMRRRCAIKVLPTKRVADSSYLARFHREAQAVAALDHPNIVRAYDVDHQTDRDAEIHFLVMEYVEGRSLQELVAGAGPCGFADAVDYIRQAALGLEHAHRAGMVHRDIKPGNLLVDLKGTVKLLDLGLARYFSSEGEGMALTIAHDEKVLGTADYLAPEQALDSHTVDHRADIYSLGCTLYFLLTGHPPFTEGTLAQRLMAHQTKEPPPVENDRPDTPASLSSLLIRMMAKQPADRPHSAQQVAQEMLEWLAVNADAVWKQSHPLLFGGLHGSDTRVGTAATSVTKPLTLTITTATEDADTEIVTRAAWPKGDLAAELTPAETEPQLSAFFAQDQPTSSTGNSSTKSSKPLAAPTKPKRDNQPPSSAEFDFLDSAISDSTKATSSIKRSPVKSPPANAVKRTSGPKLAPPLQPPPVEMPAIPAQAADQAFPSFHFENAVAPPLRPISPPGKLQPVPAKRSRANRPQAVWIAVAVIGIVVFLVGLAWQLGLFIGEDARNVGSPLDPRAAFSKRLVRVYGENADYQSLTKALEHAQRYFEPQPGSQPDRLVIEVAAGTHDEQVHIDGRKSEQLWPSGILIRGDGDVVFQSEQDGPVFSFRDLNGLTVENIRIDAGNRPVGMSCSGFLNDTRLMQLRIRNFTESGLELSGVLPLGPPLQIADVRCESVSKTAVGIRIAPSAAENSSDDSSNIAIVDCQFTGPMAAGIAIQGRAPHDISIRESIFHQTAAGIRLEGAGVWRNLAITNSTFFECGVGIDFTAMPAGSSGGLVMRRNLFAKTTISPARVQSGYQEAAFLAFVTAAGLDWNLTDRVAPPTPAADEIPVFAGNGKQGVNFAFETTNAKSDKFLAPSAASPQRSAPGPNTSERDWVGAVGP